MSKQSIIVGLLMGVFFAGAMALFDLYDEKAFSIIKFIVMMVIFGGIQAWMHQRKLNKQK
jgi:hypothetical protein